MMNGPPQRIRINHDDHHATHVGRTNDGRQFFLTTPFVPAGGSEAGCEFIALYLFDAGGALLEACIDDLGPRQHVDQRVARALFESRFAALGPVRLGPIDIAPFQLERDGTIFGFVPQPPENDDEDWCVIVEPGNFMAFYPPWNGDYDT